MSNQMEYRLIAEELPQQLLELMGEVARLEREWDQLQALVDQKNATGDAGYQCYQALLADHRELQHEARWQQLEADRLAAENRSLRRTLGGLRQEVEYLREAMSPGLALLDLLEEWSEVSLEDHFNNIKLATAYRYDDWLKLRDACIAAATTAAEKEAA